MPHAEYIGNICWYNFYDRKGGRIFIRKPWHQCVHFHEDEDIFAVVKRLIDAATTIQQYGIEINTKNIDELLKPEEGQTFEGQKVLSQNSIIKI